MVKQRCDVNENAIDVEKHSILPVKFEIVTCLSIQLRIFSKANNSEVICVNKPELAGASQIIQNNSLLFRKITNHMAHQANYAIEINKVIPSPFYGVCVCVRGWMSWR